MSRSQRFVFAAFIAAQISLLAAYAVAQDSPVAKPAAAAALAR